MMYIAVPDKNDSIGRVSLSGKEYYIRFTYNALYDYWSFGLYGMDMEPVLPMTKIVPYSPLLYWYDYTDLPDGMFGCFSTEEKVGRKSFKEKRARMAYIPNSELEDVS